MNMNRLPNIVYNSHSLNEITSLFYSDAFKNNKYISKQDFLDYSRYDYALFPTYLSDLKEIHRAKSQNPNIKVGIIDPRSSDIKQYVSESDFLIVDSIEMEDFFLKYNKPIFRYYEYPKCIKSTKLNFEKKQRYIIGYHGNKIHLTSMYPGITSALENLAQDYDIELWVIYNIKDLGKWNYGLPKNLKIRHIQWHENVYNEELSNVDIGLIPTSMPLNTKSSRIVRVNSFFNDTDDDYIIRFKMPSNPGRMIVFWKLGIPVVADFLPSHFQFIKEGVNGLLASSSAGWYHSIRKLIENKELRKSISLNAQDDYDHLFCHNVQNNRFMKFLENFPDNLPKNNYKLNRNFIDDTYMKNANLFEKFSKIKSKIYENIRS